MDVRPGQQEKLKGTIMLHRNGREVNLHFDDTLRLAWQQYAVPETTADAGCRGGLARRWTELLAGIPPWQLPALLDRLVVPEGEL